MDDLVAKALGRDTPHWRVKNSCPCCRHRVPDEPHLEYDQIFAIDGGSSLKRLRDAGVADGAVFKSDYYISPDEVDKFKHEAVKKSVKKASKGRKKTAANLESDEEDDEPDQAADIALEVGGPTTEIDEDGDEWITKNIQCEPGMDDGDKLTLCVERWKANADDEKKGMFACFDEAGVFTAVCRHGFLLAYCDMIQSGEL